MKLSVDGREFNVEMAPGLVKVDGKPHKIDVKEASATKTSVNVDGMPYHVVVREHKGSVIVVTVGDKDYTVVLEGVRTSPDVVAPAASAVAKAPAPAPAKAPAATPAPKFAEQPPVCDSPLTDGVTAVMPGRIVTIKVKNDQIVKIGDVLCVLEAMKMENEIRSPKDGVVSNIQVQDGDIVNGGDLLMQVC